MILCVVLAVGIGGIIYVTKNLDEGKKATNSTDNTQNNTESNVENSKTMSAEVYTYINGNMVLESTMKGKYIDNGKSCEVTTYDSEGNMVKGVVYMMNDEGRLIHSKEYLFDGGWIETEYNVVGEMIQSIEYDEQGNRNLLSMRYYDTYHNAFDDEGRLIEAEVSYPFPLTYRYEYDARNNLIEKREFYIETMEQWDGEKYQHLEEEKVRTCLSYTYDEQGRLIEMITTKYGKLEKLISISYD